MTSRLLNFGQKIQYFEQLRTKISDKVLHGNAPYYIENFDSFLTKDYLFSNSYKSHGYKVRANQAYLHVHVMELVLKIHKRITGLEKFRKLLYFVNQCMFKRLFGSVVSSFLKNQNTFREEIFAGKITWLNSCSDPRKCRIMINSDGISQTWLNQRINPRKILKIWWTKNYDFSIISVICLSKKVSIFTEIILKTII